MLAAGLGLHVDVAVEHDETTILEAGQGVDLRQGQVVFEKDLQQSVDDRHEPVEVAPRDADRGDRFFRDPLADRQDRREVGAREVLGMGLGDFLDVDAAHVAEEQDRRLGAAIPGDRNEVLVGDRALGLDQHRPCGFAVDHDRQHVLVVGGGLVGRIRELHGAGPSCARPRAPGSSRRRGRRSPRQRIGPRPRSSRPARHRGACRGGGTAPWTRTRRNAWGLLGATSLEGEGPGGTAEQRTTGPMGFKGCAVRVRLRREEAVLPSAPSSTPV